MRLRLKRAARIRHEAGEIVEVSPAEAGFLLSTGSAEAIIDTPMRETPEEAVPKETRKEAAPKTKTTGAKK